METKEQLLKKRTIKEAIAMAILVAVLGAAGFGLSYYDDSTQNSQANVQSKNDAIKAEYESIKTQLSKQFDMLTQYEVYQKSHNSDLTLNREMVPRYIADLREENHIAKLELAVTPASDLTGADFTLKNGIMVKHEIKLSFGALSDVSIYNFIEALERKMPGIVVIHTLKLTRKEEVSKDSLIADVSEHKISPAIEGELSLFWIGVRPKPTAENAQPAFSRFKGPNNDQ